MKKYIDADKFISYLGFENTEEERDENVGEIVTLQDFDSQTAENVQETKHGKWEFKKDICGCAWFTCTNCHKYIIMTKHRLYPYCPYCGTKMDRKEEK